MKRRIIVITLLSFLVLILNNLVTPWMTIAKIHPDFALVLLLFLSRHYGRVFGQFYGFFFGLLLDFLGMGSFLGLSALAKTITGFIGGNMKGKKNRFGFVTFYAITSVIIIIHYIIIYAITFKNSDIAFNFIFIRYIIPSTLYTGIIYFLLDNLITLEDE